jgi:hypothetical protein
VYNIEMRVADIVDRGDKYIVVYDSGYINIIPKNDETRKLYWEIKLRNRRKAFGLE